MNEEHIKGRYSIVVAVISAFAVIIAALINVFAQNKIDMLEQKVAELQDEIAAINYEQTDVQHNGVLNPSESVAGDENTENDPQDSQQEMATPVAQLNLDSEEIPKEAVYHKGHAYKAYSDSMTWKNAKLYCESVGGHLDTIADIQEQLFISNYISVLDSDRRFYWIGLYYDRLTQLWSWVTAETFDYDNWSYGEPNDDYEEYFSALYGKEYRGRRVGEWNNTVERPIGTYYNLEYYGFICEWDAS